jgi:dihydroflavonol-4-reductase
MADRVLVTGATGFIAQHCIIQLAEAGFSVRGTARTSGRTREVTDVLAQHLPEPARTRLAGDFEIVGADLGSDEGWREAVEGCRFVLHVASPLPRTRPKLDDELIVPARDGTLRVLKAAHAAGVERLVLTSSIAAVIYGRERVRRFDESDWSDVNGPRIGSYEKSKTIAERAAWEYVSTLGGTSPMQLAVINPGLVLGPLLSPDWGTSGELVKRIMERDVPAIPDINFATVDVRDVASAHLAAMTTPEAAGERFICAIENHSMMDVARVLHDHLSSRGFKIPTRRLPSFVLRVMALWDGSVRLALNDLGTVQDLDNTKIRRVLQWSPRGLSEMTIAMADSMIEYGVVKPPR